MKKLLFWTTIILLTFSWSKLEKEFTPKIDIYIVRALIEQNEPFDWLLILRHIETNENIQIKTFGDIGDTLIRIQSIETVKEPTWGFESYYKSDRWYSYSVFKINELRKSLNLN